MCQLLCDFAHWLHLCKLCWGRPSPEGAFKKWTYFCLGGGRDACVVRVFAGFCSQVAAVFQIAGNWADRCHVVEVVSVLCSGSMPWVSQPWQSGTTDHLEGACCCTRSCWVQWAPAHPRFPAAESTFRVRCVPGFSVHLCQLTYKGGAEPLLLADKGRAPLPRWADIANLPFLRAGGKHVSKSSDSTLPASAQREVPPLCL